MSLWDILPEDLQDYILNIRNIENEKNKPKIRYYRILKPNLKIIYFLNIIKVIQKSFKAGVIGAL